MTAEVHEVAVIGGGFAGIAAAHDLQRAGVRDFTVFEADDGPGGTWRVNTYRGCEVDVPSHAYSFSFLPYDWARTHARQPDLERYADHVIDTFGLRPHFRFGTRVQSVVWDEVASAYEVTTSDGVVATYRFVVAGLGLLSVPRYPQWPGLETFEGTWFHTSDWPHDLDLRGKRVAVVGTGSTAVQVVPAIADDTAQLYVYQREPGWIEPKNERELAGWERVVLRRVPGAAWARRMLLFWRALRRFKGYDTGSRRQEQMRRLCLDYIERSIDDPATRAAVTPHYPWGCKRPVLTSTFYPTLNREDVHLVPHAVTRVTPTGVVDATGTEHEVDVLVLSTGFQPTRFLAGVKVVGRDGQEIQDAWGDRPRAFLGVTVPRFPNLFLLYGPNTNGGSSVIAQIERQTAMVRRSVIRVRSRGHRLVDTRASALDRYTRWIDRQLVRHASAMEAGCHNYYHSESGANVTQWPRSSVAYWVAHQLLPRLGLVYE